MPGKPRYIRARWENWIGIEEFKKEFWTLSDVLILVVRKTEREEEKTDEHEDYCASNKAYTGSFSERLTNVGIQSYRSTSCSYLDIAR